MNDIFDTGNVVRNKKSKELYVIIDANDERINMIPFNSVNCIVGASMTKSFRTEMCGCWYDQRGVHYDSECKTCNGTGRVKVQNSNARDYKLEAETIKDFIIDRLTKKFEF